MSDVAHDAAPGARPIVWHAGAYLAVNLVLAAGFFVNKGRMAMREINGIFDYWPLWVHLGWGLILWTHFALASRRARASRAT